MTKDPTLADYTKMPIEVLRGLRMDYKRLGIRGRAIQNRAEKHLAYIAHAISAYELRDKLPSIEVSDHAVVRYLERAQGVDVEAVRRSIRELASAHSDNVGDLLLEAPDMLIVLDDNRVSTILGTEMEPAGEPRRRSKV